MKKKIAPMGGLLALSDEESKAFNEFLKKNKGLVYSAFYRNRYHLNGLSAVDKDDAIQEAFLGLWRAKQGHDPKKATIGTYGFIRMKQRLQRMAQDGSKTGVRVPANIYNDHRKINRLAKELERRPTDQEIKDKYGWTSDHLALVREGIAVRNAGKVELDSPTKFGDDDDTPRLDRLVTDQNSVAPQENATEVASERERLKQLLAAAPLDKRELKILRLRYGLGPSQTVHTLEEIAQKLDLTRERIRQIEVKILDKLRAAAKRLNRPITPVAPPPNALSRPTISSRKNEQEIQILLHQALKQRKVWMEISELRHLLARQLGWKHATEEIVEELLVLGLRQQRLQRTEWRWSTRAVTMYRTRSDG